MMIKSANEAGSRFIAIIASWQMVRFMIASLLVAFRRVTRRRFSRASSSFDKVRVRLRGARTFGVALLVISSSSRGAVFTVMCCILTQYNMTAVVARETHSMRPSKVLAQVILNFAMSTTTSAKNPALRMLDRCRQVEVSTCDLGAFTPGSYGSTVA
jgi:hypothetical protein